MNNLEHIHSVIKLFSKKQISIIFLRRFIYSFSFLLLALCLALILNQFFHVQKVLYGFCIISFFIFSQLVFFFYRIKKTSLENALNTLEHLSPELGTQTRSAISLGEQLHHKNLLFSKDLMLEHINSTSKKLNTLDIYKKFKGIQNIYFKKAYIVFCAIITITLVLSWVLSDSRDRLYQSIFLPDLVLISDVPLVNDIEIIYEYPSYTGLKPRRIEGGNGNISALIGTQVHIKTITDDPIKSAHIHILETDNSIPQNITMKIGKDKRVVSTQFSILRDGYYYFSLQDSNGDFIKEHQHKSIRAILDKTPTIDLIAPQNDIQINSEEKVRVDWKAKDDFGITKINLVIEQNNEKEIHIPLLKDKINEKINQGTYFWDISNFKNSSDINTQFYLEVFDNDVLNGPKRSVSQYRKLVVFDTRENHKKILSKQRDILYSLVDLLAIELINPIKTTDISHRKKMLDQEESLLSRISDINQSLADILTHMGEDTLSPQDMIDVFNNIHEKMKLSYHKRQSLVKKISKNQKYFWEQLSSQKKQDIIFLEKYIIYLDDLLALQHIVDLKETAQELLNTQRNLQTLLAEFQETQSPELRNQLEHQIKNLRHKMLELLSRMAQTKKQLPGEYRNLEANSMRQLDKQLERLEKNLNENNLDKALVQLEELANMIEKMMDSIEKTEEEYAGDKYDGVRKDLDVFAKEFVSLEEEQKKLSQKTDDLLDKYRKKSLEKVSKNIDDFVKKARAKTHEALRQLDEIATQIHNSALNIGRNKLIDLDILLESKDFLEARKVVLDTLEKEKRMKKYFAKMQKNQMKNNLHLKNVDNAFDKAIENTNDVKSMLEKLFPNTQEILSKKDLDELNNMQEKQNNLDKRAQELDQKMSQLNNKMPIFSDQLKSHLKKAKNAMTKSQNEMQNKELPNASMQAKRAVESLGKFRKELDKRSKKSQGIPLPIGGQKDNSRRRHGNSFENQDIEIPQINKEKQKQHFRKKLLEATKQKPPSYYKKSVKQYYKELIR